MKRVILLTFVLVSFALLASFAEAKELKFPLSSEQKRIKNLGISIKWINPEVNFNSIEYIA